MASPDEKFPAADVKGELNPDENKDFKVDPVSSELATSLKMKEQAEAAEKKIQKEKKDAMQTFKNTIIVSGIILAIAGAAFAITKKLKEK